MTSKVANCALTVEQICSIIKACGESGVAVLKYRGLEVTMSNVVAPPPSVAIPGAAMPVETQEIVEQSAILKQEIDTKEDKLARSLVEDPVLHEELLFAGDLEDGKPRTGEETEY